MDPYLKMVLIIFAICVLYYQAIFKPYAKRLEAKHSVKLRGLPSVLMILTFGIVILVPAVTGGAFDPLSIAGDGISAWIILKLLLACVPASLVTFFLVLAKSRNPLTAVISTILTILVGFAAVFLVFWLAILKIILAILRTMGLAVTEEYVQGGKSYSCPNCGANVTMFATKCPKCGVGLRKSMWD